MINVTKTFLPPIEEYNEYIKGIWDRVQLTNNGPLVRELEARLKEYLGVKHCLFVSNGTIAIQLGIKALGLTKEIITTPFSYCATSHTILWENCTPVFVDISPEDMCIDPSKIEAAITPDTQAILATHVYGNPCDVKALEAIGQKHNIKILYDAAHAFGVQIDGRSVLTYGDFSTLSFHSTKVFHTIEGGAIITDNDDLAWLLDRYRSFGHIGDENYYTMGINGKNSEFHAAMGLCNFKHLPAIFAARKRIFEIYDSILPQDKLFFPKVSSKVKRNWAYYPVFFESETVLHRVKTALEAQGIIPRRYFYPSLSTLKFVTAQSNCPISDDLSLRVLALPLFYGLADSDVQEIARIVAENC
jgi:dTDP-4-amino-4,6-dideoxygalactose transaminase